jgi:hypothetical protein
MQLFDAETRCKSLFDLQLLLKSHLRVAFFVFAGFCFWLGQARCRDPRSTLSWMLMEWASRDGFLEAEMDHALLEGLSPLVAP